MKILRFVQCALFVVCLATFSSVPIFAARAVQGAVGEVSTADAAALGEVGFRIWSALPGGTSAVNNNVASCRNIRCIRSFVTNSTLAGPGAPGGGGYVGNSEATNAYNADAQESPFYELADASMNDTSGSHIGYFGVAGVAANNAGVGAFLADGCAGSNAQNCFNRLDMGDALPPLAGTNAGYGGPAHTVRAIGGLNPIPNVRVITGAGCPGGAGKACLTWNDPPMYTSAMRPSTVSFAPPSPVVGVRLWVNDRLGTCTEPAGNDPGWTSIGTFAIGSNSYVDALPSGPACRYYALTIRLVGPGGLPNEIETFRIGMNSQPVNLGPTAVKIAHFDVTYSGHGIVNVAWVSGLEGDVLGYYVTRSVSPSGPFARMSPLVTAKGDGSRYAVTDHVSAESSRSYTYRLEILGRDGVISNSSPSTINLPGRTRRVGPAVR